MSIFDFNSSSSNAPSDDVDISSAAVNKVMMENIAVKPEFDGNRCISFPLDAIDFVHDGIVRAASASSGGDESMKVRKKGAGVAELYMKAGLVVELGARMGLTVGVAGFDSMKEGEKHGAIYGLGQMMCSTIDNTAAGREAFASECIASLRAVSAMLDRNESQLKASLVNHLEQNHRIFKG